MQNEGDAPPPPRPPPEGPGPSRGATLFAPRPIPRRPSAARVGLELRGAALGGSRHRPQGEVPVSVPPWAPGTSRSSMTGRV